MAAWRFRCFGGISLGNEFLPETNGLRHVRHLVLRPWRIHQASLTIDAAAGAGALPDATNPDSVTLKKGDSAGSLDGWAGTNYALTMGTDASKLTDEARVYANPGAPTRKPFGEVHTVAESGADKGYLTTLTAAKAMASAFVHDGTQNHPHNATGKAEYRTRGTYDGAPGEFRCTGTCSSTNDNTGSPSELAGSWAFKPDAGAMVSQSDANYLYFGWWVSKDKDGGPTAASAFTGRQGYLHTSNNPTGLTYGWIGSKPANLTGSASYEGPAVGKFAWSNPVDGTGNGGHFTADAELEATFSSSTAANVGVTGTIDNFRLNDGSSDPGDRVPSRGVRAWRPSRYPAGRAGRLRLPRRAA